MAHSPTGSNWIPGRHTLLHLALRECLGLVHSLQAGKRSPKTHLLPQALSRCLGLAHPSKEIPGRHYLTTRSTEGVSRVNTPTNSKRIPGRHSLTTRITEGVSRANTLPRDSKGIPGRHSLTTRNTEGVSRYTPQGQERDSRKTLSYYIAVLRSNLSWH